MKTKCLVQVEKLEKSLMFRKYTLFIVTVVHSVPIIGTVRLTVLLVIRTECFFVPIMNVRLTRTSPSPRYPDEYCFVRLTGVQIMGTKFCPNN